MNKTQPHGDAVGASILFSENTGLAFHLANKYARRYPHADLDDLVQVALEALWNAAEKHNPQLEVPFGAYAMKGILWGIWGHLRATPRLSSLDDILGTSDEGTMTVGDLFDFKCAVREENARIPNERNEAALADLREAIASLNTLTPRERELLTLRYIEGIPTQDLQLHFGIGRVTIANTCTSGIKKLRHHFRLKGLKVARGKISTSPIDGWSKKERHGSRP